VHDDLRPCPADGPDDRVAIERVGDDRLGAECPQRAVLGRERVIPTTT
jgi:hypothetical protein